MNQFSEFLRIEIFLSDKKYIRSRTVYDLITLIAEVSGFADLFVLGFGSLINFFYSPKALDAEVLNHMQFKVNKKKKKIKKKFEANKPIKLDM
jgi:hypothetical protein